MHDTIERTGSIISIVLKYTAEFETECIHLFGTDLPMNNQ